MTVSPTLMLMFCSCLPALACGPSPGDYSRACTADADCGLARLDPCSTCYTHAFSLEDARRADADAEAARGFCLFPPSSCDFPIVEAVCESGMCEISGVSE